MTESEWLASEDPVAMLRYLQAMNAAVGVGVSPYPVPHTSDRKLRLFACACARQAWRLMCDPRSHDAVEAAERHADGFVTGGELSRKWRVAAADAAAAAADAAAAAADADAAAAAAASGYRWWWHRYRDRPAYRKAQSRLANILRDIIGNPFRPALPLYCECDSCCGRGRWAEGYQPELECPDCDGKGLRPDSPWLTSDVLSLAHAAYDLRRDDGTLDPVRLSILADALTDVGCVDDIVAHLRDDRPHYRGRHVVDVLLGRH